MKEPVYDELPSQRALQTDCEDLKRFFTHEPPGITYREGFVVIRSDRRLVVTAVYTSASIGGQGGAAANAGIHVDQILERQIDAPDGS